MRQRRRLGAKGRRGQCGGGRVEVGVLEYLRGAVLGVRGDGGAGGDGGEGSAGGEDAGASVGAGGCGGEVF